MSVRILEMHRILKSTGGLYLHCDPTMSHYLKCVLDSIFDRKNFINEIIWKRSTAHNDARRYGAIHDTILFYAKSGDYTWNKTYTPYSQEYIDMYYKFKDERGRYWTHDLSAKGLSGGGYRYRFRGIDGLWRFPKERMEELDEDNRIHWPKKRGAMPKIKRYLKDAKGIPLQDLVTDIRSLAGLGANKKERTGYPTQKPLPLLERLITAASNKGDMVFDPFCGCATACLAAEKLERSWIGIDVSPKAYDLINYRLKNESGLDRFKESSKGWEVIQRTDIPVREVNRSKDIKRKLFGEQMGRCNGCKNDYQYKDLEVDHVIPTIKGGQDDDSNLQLLCGHCNRMKGGKEMKYLIDKLRKAGFVS